jgi:hypothetical protein
MKGCTGDVVLAGDERWLIGVSEFVGGSYMVEV